MAFTADERAALGLQGLLPPVVSTPEEQVLRAFERFGQTPPAIDRALQLAALQSRNQTLFYRLLIEHLPEMLPIVYTPTVGTVIQQYSRDFRRPGGVYLSIDEPEAIRTALHNFGLVADPVDLVVVTDGEGIWR